VALKNKEVNPLEVLNSRKLLFIPHHFHKVNLPRGCDIKIIDQWISFNLNNRYSIDFITQLHDNKIVINICAGFEDPKEATIFILSCPHFTKD
jgi:hypothetical protein